MGNQNSKKDLNYKTERDLLQGSNDKQFIIWNNNQSKIAYNA